METNIKKYFIDKKDFGSSEPAKSEKPANHRVIATRKPEVEGIE